MVPLPISKGTVRQLARPCAEVAPRATFEFFRLQPGPCGRARFGLKIGHMHGVPFENGSSGERGAIRGYWVVLQILCKRRIDDRVREQIESSLSPAPHGGSLGRAEALGGLHNGV